MPTQSALRVLLITVRADVGGGPLHVDLLINHLPTEVKWWVACPNEKPFGDAWRRNPSVRRVYHVPHRQFSVLALLRLSAACSSERITLVHSHGKGAGIYARLLKILHPSLKVVHSAHGVHVDRYGWLMKAISLTVERRLCRLTDAFISVSKGEQAISLRYGLIVAEKSHVIYNGLPAPSPCEPFPIPEREGRRVIFTAARFDIQKNMTLALEIAARCYRTHPDWLFLWAGDGPQRASLEQRARNAGLCNIHFLGCSDRIQNLLAAADVFLSTALWEGLPYALIEASARGVPIVASRVTGNDEVVLHDKNGLLYEIGNPDEAVCAITAILSDTELRNRLSEGGKKFFGEQFRLDESIRQTNALYLSL